MTRIYLRYSTYGELFKAALEEWIESGGDVSRIVTLVNIYQGNDPVAERLEFQDWLQGSELSCELCGRTFSPDLQEVFEDDNVLCSKCTK